MVSLSAHTTEPASAGDPRRSLPIAADPRRQDDPAEVVVEWSLTLVEPLLTPQRRNRLEERFEAVAHRHPRWSATFVAGVLADVAGTLPAHDPWRHLSARIGHLTRGPAPPEATGATRGSGEPFGTWADATDLVALVFARPEIDAALAALSDDLDPAAAALVAFAPAHWSEVAAATGELWALTTGTPLPDHPGAGEADPALAGAWHASAHQALRWVVFRRRSHGATADDPWPVEACYRWSVFATALVAGKHLDEEAVAGAIDDERVLLASPDEPRRPPPRRID